MFYTNNYRLIIFLDLAKKLVNFQESFEKDESKMEVIFEIQKFKK